MKLMQRDREKMELGEQKMALLVKLLESMKVFL